MLTREQILAALAALNEKLQARDTHGELALLGGAVMDIILRYYPPSRVPSRAVFLVREILAPPPPSTASPNS